SSDRLDIIVKGNGSESRLVNVLQVTRVGAPVSAVHAIKSVSGNVVGVDAGGWVVLLGNSDKVVPPVSYNIEAARQMEHLALDLPPDSTFIITVKDLKARKKHIFPKKSSA